MNEISYLNIKHLGAGHILFVLIRVFARFQHSCTLEASLHIFEDSIGSMRGPRIFCQVGGPEKSLDNVSICPQLILQFTEEVLEHMNVPGNDLQIHNTVVVNHFI